MIVSSTSSFINLCLSLSVEIDTLVVVAINSSFDILGNVSLTACKASIQAVRSSLDAARKCRLFVPVNTVNLLLSDMPCPIHETYKKHRILKNMRAVVGGIFLLKTFENTRALPNKSKP